jgi:hypothetical protein
VSAVAERRVGAHAQWVAEHVGTNPTAALYADDLPATYDALRARGVVVTEPPQQRPFGLQAAVHDRYGNRDALLQRGVARRPASMSGRASSGATPR